MRSTYLSGGDPVVVLSEHSPARPRAGSGRDSCIEDALIDAKGLLDLALRVTRTAQSSAHPLAQHFASVEALREATSMALLSARIEVLCVVKPIWSRDGSFDAVSMRISALNRLGVRVRQLYSPEPDVDWPDGAGSADHLTRSGVEVRVIGQQLHEMVVIDSRIALLRSGAEPSRPEYVAVRSPAIVRCIRALFLAAWSRARDLEAYTNSREFVNETTEQVLQCLSTGRKDDAAARELGLSVRTYRRYVARLMSDLDADTRFQAGVRAAQLGLIDGPLEQPVTTPQPIPTARSTPDDHGRRCA
jgi:DNA-binding CsgD family transcriptional regulator